MFDISTLENFVSPIQKINIDNEVNNINIYIKRDDLLPFSFGGNKVRIAKEYYEDIISQGKDCIIGYGNVRSNLCRVLANFSRTYKIPCYIVSPLDDSSMQKTSNSRLVELCGATIRTCDKSEVAKTIQNVIDDCKEKGLDPYYINGNIYGTGNESVPVRAYKKVYDEIKKQSKELNVNFDYIFLATGTGSTQAGLIVGKKINNGTENIIGISVARPASICISTIAKYANAYLEQNQQPTVTEDVIMVSDKYLCNGYGKYDDSIVETIVQIYNETGIALDPCYSGKGFAGMLKYLNNNNIKNKNVLFIHTGGTPLFFDFINKPSASSDICECTDVQELITFLNSVNQHLPVPLSERVSIDAYATKVINHGKVLCIKENGEIISAALLYCNDTLKKQAYLTLLATLPTKQKAGHASLLLKSAEAVAKAAKMTSIHLDTDYSNMSAIRLYSKNNYKIIEAKEKIHMAKDL